MWGIRAAVLVGSLALAACAGTEIRTEFPSVPQPAVQVGDTWRYRVIDGFTKQLRGVQNWENTEVRPNAIVMSVREEGRVPGLSCTYTREWNPETGRTPEGLPLEPLTSGIASGQTVRYAPAYPAFRFPLEAGKRWNERVLAQDPESRKQVAIRVHARVVGAERIRLPAGEFETVKVRREVYYEDGEWWRSPISAHELDWYAPQLNQVVRRRLDAQFWDYSSGGRDDGAVLRDGDSLVYELETHAPAARAR